MANEGGAEVEGRSWKGKTAPGLAGIYGRLRLSVAGKPLATLVVEGTYVVLVPDASGPSDATLLFADDETLRRMLKGVLNPFIASMQRQARVLGDRGFATKVMLGLQVQSPFAADGGKEELP
jgi:putative sterol carrier protein